jgi:hypothetical protein
VAPDSVSVAKRKGYHTLYLDLETEGLISKFWSRALGSDPMNLRRARAGMPRISEVALRGANSSFNVFGYTDIVTKDMLERHGVTRHQLRNLNARLPVGLYRELIGASGPALWDPSVAIEGSVLNKIFRRHGRHAIRGRGQPSTSLVGGVVEALERASLEGQVTLTGWNITGFDLPVLLGNATADQSARLGNLIRSGAVNITEGAENYYRVLFNRVVHGGHIPMMTDRAALNAAGGVRILNAQQARQYLRPNMPLYQFGEDIKANITGKDAFQRRAEAWARSYRGTNRGQDAQRVASRVAKRLSSIKDYDSYLRILRRSQLAHSSYMGGWNQSFYEVVGEMYRQTGMDHTHVLGDVKKMRGNAGLADRVAGNASTRTMAGRINAFQFVLGGEQGQVGESLLRAMQELNDPRVPELTRALRGAHTGSRDTRALEIISRLMAPSPENRDLLQAFERHHFNEERLDEIYTRRIANISEDQGTLARVNEIFAGSGAAKQAARVPKSKAGRHRAFLTSTRRRLRNIFRTPEKPIKGMLRAGAALAGAALLFDMIGPSDDDLEDGELKERARKRMEGIRRPESMYRRVEGINPSDMEYANVSHFHSGANIWDGMATASYLSNEQMWSNPYIRDDDDQFAAFKSSGILAHRALQAHLLRQGMIEDTEVPVRQFGMSSTIDAMLAGGIPLEIKSRTSQEKVEAMAGPRAKDIGQINFDILATGAPYGYIAYTSQEEPTKFKLFKILPDPARLATDTYFLETRMAADQRVPGRSILHLMGRKLSLAAQSVQEYVLNTLGVDDREYDQMAVDDPFGGMVADTVHAGEQSVAPDHYKAPPQDEVPRYVNYDNAYHPLSMAIAPNLSKIRDTRTQLHRLPGLPRSYRRRNRHMNTASMTEY